MRHGIDGPAMTRLEWLLDGLAGAAGWGGDASEVLAPAFTAQVPTEIFVARIQHRARSYAPLEILALEAHGNGNTARARIRRHADSPANTDTDAGATVDVVTCTVEPDAPHQIDAAYITGLVPDYVTPRLPTDFATHPLPRASGTRLVVFSGVPGAGKSTLADAVGSRLSIPGWHDRRRLGERRTAQGGLPALARRRPHRHRHHRPARGEPGRSSRPPKSQKPD